MRIVLYYPKLNMGGAEKSTVRLLNQFAAEGHDTTLFLKTKGGELDQRLSEKVKILYLYKRKTDDVLPQKFSEYFNYKSWVKMLRLVLSFFRGKIKDVYYRIKKPRFDLAITGRNGCNPMFLKKHTKYKLHFQMIRNENAIVLNGKPREFISDYKKNLDVVDAYVCVSESVRKTMIRMTGINENRIKTIYNIIANPVIYRNHQVPIEYVKFADDGDLILLTVCRLVDRTKGLIRMANVCATLKREGYKFKWFIVGDGPDKYLIKEKIAELALEDTMILCGHKTDPVDYYLSANLICVFSYMEGLCGVVNEAKLLSKPLIATRFTAIDEQISHMKNGYIVDNDEGAILSGLKVLLSNTELRESLACNDLPEIIQDNTYKVNEFVNLYKEIMAGGI